MKNLATVLIVIGAFCAACFYASLAALRVLVIDQSIHPLIATTGALGFASISLFAASTVILWWKSTEK